jgi:nucleoside-diphosphate-sugar epimerase
MEPLAGKRLVIFGCGYIGTAVALESLSRGLRVTALTRNAASAVVLREQGIDAVVADLASSGWHEQISGGPEFVLNCVSSGAGGTNGYRHSYVDGMVSILNWARHKGPIGTMVYTSSTSVYPQGDGASVDERAMLGGTERAGILVEAEEKLQAAKDTCRRWFILRFAGIYGPGRHHFIEQMRSGEVAGRGEHHLNLIHRDDAAAAIWACFTASSEVKNEIFNVADDGPARKTEIAVWVAQQLQLAVPRFTGEPTSARRGITPDRIIANDKLKTRLGWRPRYATYREGCANFLSR